MRKFYLLCITLLTTIILSTNVSAEEENIAKKLKVNITTDDVFDVAKINDAKYTTSVKFAEGKSITLSITSKSSEGTKVAPAQGIYLEWNKAPGEYTITAGGKTYNCGKNDYLHEYIEFDSYVEEGDIVITAGKASKLCDVYVFGEGNLPDWVQKWEPACEKADILIFSTHADDEVLFFGGIATLWGGTGKASVQVVYFSEYYTGAVQREHEKLDGLWAMGIKNYPVTDNFPDKYAANYDAAVKNFGYDKSLEFAVHYIRRFKPQIVVTHDIDGEYGHGTHVLLSKVVRDAIDITADETKFPELAQQYGTHEVAKTYIHLYEENQIVLDMRNPLPEFDGLTGLEVCDKAYKKHVTQQWTYFKVSDTWDYSISEFGLYKTTVGVDTGNNILENIVTYAEQERLEKESIEQASREQASKEAESKEQASKEAESKEQASREEQSRIEASKEAASIKAAKEAAKATRRNATIIVIVVAILAIFAGYILICRKNKR